METSPSSPVLFVQTSNTKTQYNDEGGKAHLLVLVLPERKGKRGNSWLRLRMSPANPNDVGYQVPHLQ